MVGLCDCNNFFVSCERVFNPSLNGKPVVVLSNNDGCVISRSNEAKAIGIKMGQPYYQVKTMERTHGLRVFSSNYTLYGDMSQRVMSLLRQEMERVEVYSIDEAFIDFSLLPAEAHKEAAQRLCQQIRKGTGIPVSIGISSTKTLAKIAAKLCKSYPRLNGVCVMQREEDIRKVLLTYPINDVWGIGRRYSKMLQSHGVNTAMQFTAKSNTWVRHQMGVTGLRTWEELHGRPCIEIDHDTPAKQQICVSRSFASELTSYDELHRSILIFTTTAAEKLRKQRSVCEGITVFVASNRFKDNYAYDNRLYTFHTATDNTNELATAASQLLSLIYNKEVPIKKAGVVLSSISDASRQVHSLFDTIDRHKQYRLMQTIDKVNNSISRDKIRLAAEGWDEIATNREHVSARYTTCWKEIPEVVCK